jgi:hypothetical protein
MRNRSLYTFVDRPPRPDTIATSRVRPQPSVDALLKYPIGTLPCRVRLDESRDLYAIKEDDLSVDRHYSHPGGHVTIVPCFARLPSRLDERGY